CLILVRMTASIYKEQSCIRKQQLTRYMLASSSQRGTFVLIQSSLLYPPKTFQLYYTNMLFATEKSLRKHIPNFFVVSLSFCSVNKKVHFESLHLTVSFFAAELNYGHTHNDQE